MLLNRGMNFGFALTLTLSRRRGNKRVLAPFSCGRRVGDEGKSYEYSATSNFLTLLKLLLQKQPSNLITPALFGCYCDRDLILQISWRFDAIATFLCNPGSCTKN